MSFLCRQVGPRLRAKVRSSSPLSDEHMSLRGHPEDVPPSEKRRMDKNIIITHEQFVAELVCRLTSLLSAPAALAQEDVGGLHRGLLLHGGVWLPCE